jgi:hypothetical protein
MPITSLPTPPSRGDAPEIFIARADQLLAALPTFVTEANAQAAVVDTKSALAVSAADSAADDALSAADSAAGAANSAALAQTSESAVALADSLSGSSGTSLIGTTQGFSGAVARTQADKNTDVITPKDAGATGDGVADDTSHFAALDAAYPGRTVDLLGKTYLVTALPTGANYKNGFFKVGVTTYKASSSDAIISDPTDTGALEAAYSGGLIPAPTVPGRSTTDLYALIASQNCRSFGPARAANLASIYSQAGGNLSANMAARQSSALMPQSANIATEECVADTGSRLANIASIMSYAEGVSAGNLMSRSSHASGWEAACVASNSSVAGAGSGARLRVNVTAGVVTSIDVLSGGSGYITPTIDIIDRWAQGSGATATATVAGGVITAVTVTAGGSDYTSVADGVNAHVYTGRTMATVAASGSSAKGAQSAVMASANSVTLNNQSAVIASNRSTAGGINSAVIAAGPTSGGSGTTETQATGDNSAILAGGGNLASGQYSAVVGSSLSTATNLSAVVIGSRRTLNDQARSLCGGDSSSGSASTANRKWHLLGNGNIQAAGALTGSVTFTDYAEYFENLNAGTIPLGTLVALEGRKVKPAQPGDAILGVVSATALVVAGDSPFTWSGRYLTGEFGEALYHDVDMVRWSNDENTFDGRAIDAILEYGEIPAVATRYTERHPIENPRYDPTQENVPRSQRPDDWSCIGLLGQVHVRVDASVLAGDAVAAGAGGIGTKSDGKTNMQCMEIRRPLDPAKGYAVAFCLVR